LLLAACVLLLEPSGRVWRWPEEIPLMMIRIRLGLHLARESLRVLRTDRSLVLFPFASIVSAIAAFNLVAVIGVAIAAATQVKLLVIPGLLAGAYAATYCAIFCNVALAGAVQLSLGGRDTHFSDGWAAARKRRSLIAKWAGVQLLFGVVAAVLDGSRAGSTGVALARRVAGSVIGAGWAVATFFVVPVIALEGLGPRAALRRSYSLVKEKWGEGLTGTAAIGFAVFVVAFGPLSALFAGASALDTNVSHVAGGIAYFVAMTAFVASCALGSTLSAIFRVELYRYSVDQHPTKQFATDDLEAAFS
jgi:hypothetical protein